MFGVFGTIVYDGVKGALISQPFGVPSANEYPNHFCVADYEGMPRVPIGANAVNFNDAARNKRRATFVLQRCQFLDPKGALLVIFVVFAWLHVGVDFVGAFHDEAAVVVNGRTPVGEVTDTVISPLFVTPGHR